MGGVPNARGPHPHWDHLGPITNGAMHKSWVSLRDPPCAHVVFGTPHGEVRDNEHVTATGNLKRPSVAFILRV